MRYYLDTEFNGFGGELISMALVREDGKGEYFIINGVPNLDPWVAENVMPILSTVPTNTSLLMCAYERDDKRSAAEMIARFLHGDPFPVIVTDWPADIRYFCELIEFPMGQMAEIPTLEFQLKRVDAYPTTLNGAVQHNAWWDAMALRYFLTGAEPC